jgi:hypothetical protein
MLQIVDYPNPNPHQTDKSPPRPHQENALYMSTQTQRSKDHQPVMRICVPEATARRRKHFECGSYQQSIAKQRVSKTPTGTLTSLQPYKIQYLDECGQDANFKRHLEMSNSA